MSSHRAGNDSIMFLAGEGQYVDDIHLPRLAYAAIVRSPYAHATILKIDSSEALNMKGVIGVITGDDIKSSCKPIGQAHDYPIAIGKVRFVGEPVAVIVANDRAGAEDAAEKVEVKYSPLQPVVGAEEAMLPHAPPLHEENNKNIAWSREFEFGDFSQAKILSDYLISRKFYFPRYSSTPTENYAIIADFEPKSERLTTWSNAAAVFALSSVAEALNLPSENVRHIICHSGGSFGVKISIAPYVTLISATARKFGIPIKWIETRTEHLTASVHQADRTCYVEAAVKSDGKIVGLKMRSIDNIGAYLRFPEPRNLLRSLCIFTGCYKIPNLRLEAVSVYTNKCPTGANRGYGTQHHYYILERMVDIISETIGIDRVELRKRNFIKSDEFPFENPSGSVYDSGDYGKTLDLLLSTMDYSNLEDMKKRWNKNGKRLGLGIACVVEPGLANLNLVKLFNPEARPGPASESARITLKRDDCFSVSVGSSAQGQGHSKIITELITNEIGVPGEKVEVSSRFDSSKNPWEMSSGAYSSRFNTTGVGALLGAVTEVKKKLKALGAKHFGTLENNVDLKEGLLTANDGTGRSISINQLLNECLKNDEYLEATYVYTFKFPGNTLPNEKGQINSYGTYANSATGALVIVDIETGVVKVEKLAVVSDAGKVINEEIVTGLTYGGFAHGLGGALYEEIVYDSNGNVLSTSFLDYLVPNAQSMPNNIIVKHLETPSPFTPLGSKGCGEGPAISTPAAIANAIADALTDDSAFEILEVPSSPEKVISLIRDKKSLRSGRP